MYFHILFYKIKKYIRFNKGRTFTHVYITVVWKVANYGLVVKSFWSISKVCNFERPLKNSLALSSPLSLIIGTKGEG